MAIGIELGNTVLESQEKLFQIFVGSYLSFPGTSQNVLNGSKYFRQSFQIVLTYPFIVLTLEPFTSIHIFRTISVRTRTWNSIVYRVTIKHVMQMGKF